MRQNKKNENIAKQTMQNALKVSYDFGETLLLSFFCALL